MNNLKPSVLLVSVDALKPEFIFEQERLGINLPNLKRFIHNGTVASKGVKSVFPTFTYPCHQSIITGTNPATHGIFNNSIFDPTGEHKCAWNWFVSKKVKTLWQAAKENGYVSASVAFPTSVGAKGDYIAPEFWWDGSKLDSMFIDVMSTPQGIISEMEQDIGDYVGGLDLTEAGDRQRFKATMWMLNNKLSLQVNCKPFFLSTYFASFDKSAHTYGVYSKEALHSLEQIDMMLGELIETVHCLTQDDVVVCVVSDHGIIDNQYTINPNVILAQSGLITLDEQGRIKDWRAWCMRAGGTCEIRLKDKNDTEAAQLLTKEIQKLIANSDNGILEVMDGQTAKNRGGFPLAEYVLVAKKGYEIRENVTGPYCTNNLTLCAQHGYSENFEEMNAVFLIEGRNIATQKDVGSLNLIDIAPTLAGVMGFVLPQAEGIDIMK